jgi:hypothetical protein
MFITAVRPPVPTNRFNQTFFASMNKFLLKSNSNDGDVYMEAYKRFCYHLACISLIICLKITLSEE